MHLRVSANLIYRLVPFPGLHYDVGQSTKSICQRKKYHELSKQNTATESERILPDTAQHPSLTLAVDALIIDCFLLCILGTA